MPRIGIVGVGSIGTVLARGFDDLGHDIVINDTNPDREAALPYPARPKRWLAANADYIIIAVPTPTTSQGGDATQVASVLHDLEDATGTIIIRSTMPPGTTQQVATDAGLAVVYSPEFLRDRSTVDDFYTPDRIVLAGPSPERDRARRLFDHPRIDCDTIIETPDYLTAEVGKEAHNAFFATKVSFANQLRLICQQEGADVQTAMDIVTADSRNTSSHLDPLLGPYGGRCLPKDTRALMLYGAQHSAPVPLLRGVINLNEIATREFENVEIQGDWPEIAARGD